MSRTRNHLKTQAATLWIVGLFCGAVVAADAKTPPIKGPQTQAEVTHKDVYVRSGPSMNHYTICKLQPGDRITIVSEQAEWYEILPPAGTFSLVSGEFVDTVDNQNGTVNADNVRVRAGSTINDQKYTVQAQLSRGTKVNILGRNADGFFRITPPPGATFWISRTYIEKVPDGLTKLEAQAGPAPATAAPVATSDATVVATGDPAETKPAAEEPKAVPASQPKPAAPTPVEKPKPTDVKLASVTKSTSVGPNRQVTSDAQPPSALADLAPGHHRNALEELDASVQVELAKPAGERNMEPLIQGYEQVASQADDEVAKRYAEARLGQLRNMADLVGALRRIRDLSAEADVKRQQFMAERNNADFTTLPPIRTGFDAQGELRASALYPPGSVPRRYRLIDPQVGDGRTVAYVEFPSDSKIEADGFLGQYVGVRAAEKRLQIGGVDPVPVYLVRELVRLQPGASAGATGP